MDMNQVFTAFALNYPNMAKKRDNLAENDGITDIHYSDWDYHNSHIGEFIIGDNLITFQCPQNGNPLIFDCYHNDFLNQEEVIAIKSTIMSNKAGAYWEPAIPVIKRHIDLGNAIGGRVDRIVKEDIVISCNWYFNQDIVWGYEIADINTWDFGGDIGSRWYIEIKSQYGIIERYAWDLGPKQGNFNPQYGWLSYGHIHQDTGAWAVEIYSKIVSFDKPVYPCLTLL